MSRIVYQDWIVELGRDPAGSFFGPPDSGAAATSDIIEAVSRALGRLPETEQEFIRRFYFMGETYRQLAEATGQPIHWLEKVHCRAFRHLRHLLGPFVRSRFGLGAHRPARCPLCMAQNRVEIDSLIAAKPAQLTWRPILRLLRTRFGLKLSTPQILISHACYHLPARKSTGPDQEEI